MKNLVIILLIALSITPFFSVHAQEPITAEVVFDYVHMRLGPSRGAESLTVLSSGTIVSVHAWTRYRPSIRYTPWVKVTVLNSDLTGWIRSDLLRFSVADWIERLPYMDSFEVADQILLQNEPPSLETTVYNNGSPTRVYSSPLHTNVHIAELPSRAPVILVGRSGIGGAQRFVYIRQVGGTIEGWVNVDDISSYTVDLPASFFEALPIMVQPIQTQGQVLAGTLGGQNLYTEPSFDAPAITRLTYNDILVVHGRTTHEYIAWTYVTVLQTGQTGWMYDGVTVNYRGRYIRYPNGFDYRTLPTLPASANPPLPLPVEPLQSLVTVTTFETIAYRSPYYHRLIAASIPAGTSLILTGRILNSSYFQTVYNNETVWVKFEHLQFQEGFNRLPLIY